MEQSDAVLKSWVALEGDLGRGRRLLAELGAGKRSWEDFNPAERSCVGGPALLELLWDRALSLRFSDPETMIALTEAACLLSEFLPDERYGPYASDLRARAWAEFGNALRVADDLTGADQALARASGWAELGTGDFPLLRRLIELTASLLTDLRRFEEAVQLLTELEAGLYKRNEAGDVGKVLLQLGHVHTQAHEPEAAIAVYLRVLPLLGRGHSLRLVAIHSLALNLLEAGSCEVAHQIVSHNQSLYRRSGKLNGFRLFWLEGKIALGLGRWRQAEGKLQTARLAFLRARQGFDAALVSLDLAWLFARQERRQELAFLIGQMLRTFRELGIAREVLATLLLLQKSSREKRPTDILCGQIEALARLLPELRPRSSRSTKRDK